MKNKFDTGDLFTNGENHQDKTALGEFKVTTPENSLLSITSGYKYKKSYQTLWPIPKYQPIVEPLSQYPIRHVLWQQSLRSMHESQYVTNQWCTDPSTWLTHQLEEDYWLQSSSVHQQWRLESSLVNELPSTLIIAFHLHFSLQFFF